jgi:hypothetical protein
MFFASPLPPILSMSSLPCGGELRTSLAPIKPGTAGLLSAGRTQDLPGSWRIHPISLPRSQIPAGSSALTLSDRRCCPQARDPEDASTTSMSGFNYAASISAAYASSDALPHPHARLASGWWLAFTGWESNPLDSIESFCPLHRTSSFPRLYLALPSRRLTLPGERHTNRSSSPSCEPLLDDGSQCRSVIIVIIQSRHQRQSLAAPFQKSVAIFDGHFFERFQAVHGE